MRTPAHIWKRERLADSMIVHGETRYACSDSARQRLERLTRSTTKEFPVFAGSGTGPTPISMVYCVRQCIGNVSLSQS